MKQADFIRPFTFYQVLNAAHRHYQKSKKTHKKFSDVVEAAYLDFLESIRSEDLAGKTKIQLMDL